MSKISVGSRVTRQLNERWIHWGLLHAKSPCLVQESSEPQIAVCSIDILGTISCTCSVAKFFSRHLLLPTVRDGRLGCTDVPWLGVPVSMFERFLWVISHFLIGKVGGREESNDSSWRNVNRGHQEENWKGGKFQILSFLYVLSHSPSIAYLWCEERLSHFRMHCV